MSTTFLLICCTNHHFSCLFDRCSQLVRCVWDTSKSKNIISASPEQWSPAVYKSQTVCLFVCTLNVCILVSAHLHVSWGLTCFLDAVLSTWRSTCVSCQILLIGVFHWFQSGRPVQKLCPLSVCSRNKSDNPCGSEQLVLLFFPVC